MLFTTLQRSSKAVSYYTGSTTTSLSALDIASVVGIDPNFLADIDEGGNLHTDSRFQCGWFEAGGGGRIFDAGFRVDDFEDHGRRKLNSYRAPIVKIDFDLQIGEQVTGLAFEKLGAQRQLLVRLVVHEFVRVGILI